MTPERKIELCTLKLMNINSLRLFGCLLYRFQVELVSSDITTKVFFSPDIKKPIIIFGYEFINQKTIPEIIFVYLHEIIHVLDGHGYRLGNRDPGVWNIACDHTINDPLKYDAVNSLKDQIKIPDEVVIIPNFRDKNVTAEEIYEWLIEREQQQTTKQIQLDVCGSPSCDQSPQENNDTKEESITIEVKETSIDIGYGEKVTVEQDIIFNVKKGDNQDEEQKELSNSLKSELRALESGIFKGTQDNRITQYIKKLIKVEIPWEDILAKAIKTRIKSSPNNRSWRRFNKRLYAHKITLPSNGVEEEADSLYIVKDTSSSVSTKEIEKFASVINESIRFISRIHVIYHSTRITKILEIDTEKDIVDPNELIKIVGRGGTSHKHVYHHIQKQYDNGENIGLVLMLTDFHSDVEVLHYRSKFSWIDHIPVKIVLTPDHNQVPKYIDDEPIIIGKKYGNG